MVYFYIKIEQHLKRSSTQKSTGIQQPNVIIDSENGEIQFEILALAVGLVTVVVIFSLFMIVLLCSNRRLRNRLACIILCI